MRRLYNDIFISFCRFHYKTIVNYWEYDYIMSYLSKLFYIQTYLYLSSRPEFLKHLNFQLFTFHLHLIHNFLNLTSQWKVQRIMLIVSKM